jgi:hypothetical protein
MTIEPYLKTVVVCNLLGSPGEASSVREYYSIRRIIREKR